MDPILKTLKQYWKHDAFRPMQEEIIHSILSGKDTLALLPTGGGKSICFQIPALMREGLCLVISPLIALMKDQVEGLRRKNITAFAIYSGMSRKEVINSLRLAAESNCKFLYLSPERLETTLFKEWLPALGVTLIAVDEAHCISQWGYDFRPPYLRIASLREELPGVPILALTASATREVQTDICEKLIFNNPAIYRQSFTRENISFSVFQVSSKINKILQILSKVEGSAIIYCRTRKKTKMISDLLGMHGIIAGYYHAGLNQDERNQRQEDWKNDKLRVIVCTNAFGMGIDKPDVRIVIHADCPDCLENYYQEAGRAGRDMKKSFAVLLYSVKELQELESLSPIRFPSFDQIRKVYQALVNYLQLPSGTGGGEYFDFDLNLFTRNFSLDPFEALYALKVLEQDGQIAFSDQTFLPSKAGFICNKETLFELEKSNPDQTPLVQTLLRTYSGIFDQPVPIHEKNMAFLLHQDREKILNGLQWLHANRIIEYIPQKENPQVYFVENRVNAQDLRIDMETYQKRRQQFEKRVHSFLGYAKTGDTCRAVLINDYFGEPDASPCGICDNCLKQKRKSLNRGEFELILQQIMKSVGTSTLAAHELERQFSGIPKEKFWQVLRFLESENKLTVNKEGLIAPSQA